MLPKSIEYVSVGEAAKIIGVTVSSVRRFLIDGELVGVKLNERAWAVDRKSAQEFAKVEQTIGRPRVGRR